VSIEKRKKQTDCRYASGSGDWRIIMKDFDSSLFAKLPHIALFALLLFATPVFAHSPIFMMAPEAPGKGAFDIHASYDRSKQGGNSVEEFETELTYGLTRDFAVGFSMPFGKEKKLQPNGVYATESETGNPELFTQYRFYNRDVIGAKYSAALRLSGKAPVGDTNIASTKPAYMAGLAYGMESLKWYYTMDTRYLYNVDDGGNKSGDKVFADFAVGIRPTLRGLEETDIVYFLEFNYMQEQKASAFGVATPNSGGDFFFISPEVLISPSNRLMVRGGFQIPVYQNINGVQESKDYTFRILIERRY